MEALTSARALRLFAPLLAIAFVVVLGEGIMLPITPLYVGRTLGYPAFVAGLIVGANPAVCLVARPIAGRFSDRRGPRATIVVGVLAHGVGGIAYVVAAHTTSASAALASMCIGRGALGLAQSYVVTGACAWATGCFGKEFAGRVFAWTGIATWGAIGAGGVGGIALHSTGGFRMVAVAALVLAVVAGVLLAVPLREAQTPRVENESIVRVFAAIMAPGLANALAAVGAAGTTAFATALYVENGWPRADVALAAFAVAFVGSRLVLARFTDVQGQLVAVASLLLEVVGQTTLWRASSATMACVGAAVTGFGYSLVAPALGALAVRRLPAERLGAGVGSFGSFRDLGLIVAGPAMGAAAGAAGYHAAFEVGTIASALGFALVGREVWISRRSRRRRSA